MKLQNVLLDEEGHLKMFDFSLVMNSTWVGQKFREDGETGTPSYLTPEVRIISSPQNKNFIRNKSVWHGLSESMSSNVNSPTLFLVCQHAGTRARKHSGTRAYEYTITRVHEHPRTRSSEHTNTRARTKARLHAIPLQKSEWRRRRVSVDTLAKLFRNLIKERQCCSENLQMRLFSTSSVQMEFFITQYVRKTSNICLHCLRLLETY